MEREHRVRRFASFAQLPGVGKQACPAQAGADFSMLAACS